MVFVSPFKIKTLHAVWPIVLEIILGKKYRLTSRRLSGILYSKSEWRLPLRFAYIPPFSSLHAFADM